jgi:predicted RNase H-like HicB family nuclease
MKNKVIVTVEFDGTYSACIDKLPGCIAVANTLPELRSLMSEAVELHIELLRAHNEEIPTDFMVDYELVYRLDTQGLLVTYDGIFTKSALSRMSGINEKLLWHYASGKKHPRPVQRQRIATALHSLGNELLTVEL